MSTPPSASDRHDRHDRPDRHALTAEAADTAARAAAAAQLRIADVEDPEPARSASALFDRVWGRDASAGTILAPEALLAIAHAGGQVSVGRDADGEVVAATAALLGRDHATGQVFLHSHVTGVLAEAGGSGAGKAMKWYQRQWALERGIEEVRWTFDPLVRRNVVLNLAVLGAGVAGYLVDRYGAMADARNRGLPTDRLEARWQLGAPRVRQAAAGRVATPDVEALVTAGAQVALEVGEDGQPVAHTTSAARRLVRIPADIESLRAQDHAAAAAWAQAIRATLRPALDAGARVSGVTRDGWYVLADRGGVAELAGR